MIKKTIIISLILSMPLTVNAGFLDMNLAKRCHQLSIKLVETKELESNVFCAEKLYDASISAEMAGEAFTEDDNFTAKLDLQLAIKALNYSTVENCSEVAKIVNYKNELQDILLWIK
ncbi:hypothetical protein [Legionella drozanskii]|uniref:Uncharacterized protein n=1 Tax=Legionella drozanskii LLAP-1 TaxID=1212489 RepID=A0A0W0T0I9_9GAMM|nr:hypothetical protein [Legionella drozanskii]KTC89123.1 hypothetical protein Ldro_0781 [Legionella drozanskii LLAP-1]